MNFFNKMHGGTIVTAIIAAIAMLATAHNGNTWLYIFIIWIVIFAAFEVYYSRKNKRDKGQ